MTNYYWYYKEEKCRRGAAILWFIMFPAFLLLCMHPTASSCYCVVTDAFFTQAVISVFACYNTANIVFLYFLHCFRGRETADLHALLCYTKHAYSLGKKSRQKRRDCLVTLVQIKGAEFFYINYTSIQGWEVSMATLLSYGMHKAPSILWNYYLPFQIRKDWGKDLLRCASVNINT